MQPARATRRHPRLRFQHELDGVGEIRSVRRGQIAVPELSAHLVSGADTVRRALPDDSRPTLAVVDADFSVARARPTVREAMRMRCSGPVVQRTLVLTGLHGVAIARAEPVEELHVTLRGEQVCVQRETGRGGRNRLSRPGSTFALQPALEIPTCSTRADAVGRISATAVKPGREIRYSVPVGSAGSSPNLGVSPHQRGAVVDDTNGESLSSIDSDELATGRKSRSIAAATARDRPSQRSCRRRASRPRGAPRGDLPIRVTRRRRWRVAHAPEIGSPSDDGAPLSRPNE
jgi:hypothetical protein